MQGKVKSENGSDYVTFEVNWMVSQQCLEPNVTGIRVTGSSKFILVVFNYFSK